MDNIVNIYELRLAREVVDDMLDIIEILETCREKLGQDKFLKYKDVINILGQLDKRIFHLDGMYEYYQDIVERSNYGFKIMD